MKLQLLPEKQHKVKTRVMRRTLNPVYDEDFTFYGVQFNQLPVRNAKSCFRSFVSEKHQIIRLMTESISMYRVPVLPWEETFLWFFCWKKKGQKCSSLNLSAKVHLYFRRTGALISSDLPRGIRRSFQTSLPL